MIMLKKLPVLFSKMSGLIRRITGWFRNVEYNLSGSEGKAYSETVRELRDELFDLRKRYEALEVKHKHLEDIRDPTTIQMVRGQLDAARKEAERYQEQIKGFAEASRGQKEQIEGLYRVINETCGLIGHLKKTIRERREDRFNDCKLLARLIDRYVSPSFLIGPEGDVQWAGRRTKKILGDITNRKYYDVLKMINPNGSPYKTQEIIEFFDNPRMQAEMVSINDVNSHPIESYMLKRPMFYRQQQIGSTTKTEGKHDVTFGILLVEEVLKKRLEFFDKMREARKRQGERVNSENNSEVEKIKRKARFTLIESEIMIYEQGRTLEDIQLEAILENQGRTVEKNTNS